VHNIAVRGYVGVTDQDWYEFLRSHPEQTEVNFWRPKDKSRFSAIRPGEYFFFKLKAVAHNLVVGGGVFVGWELVPLSAAWEFYGPGNGASTLDALRAMIGGLAELGASEDPEIGCILLKDVVFFEDEGIAGPPPEFARNLVQGRTYELDDPRYGGYFDVLSAQMTGHVIEIDYDDPSWQHHGPMFSEVRLGRQRLGQRGFQTRVFNAYHRRCAVTDTKIWPALQAAHIRPVTRGGEHRLDNGLLLRSDVHTMFDRGYLAVDPSYRLRVSPRLRDEFGNGEQFYAKAGHPISLPARKTDRPRREFLEWHLEEIFKAS
jgi:putative restriction endonuclease